MLNLELTEDEAFKIISDEEHQKNLEERENEGFQYWIEESLIELTEALDQWTTKESV